MSCACDGVVCLHYYFVTRHNEDHRWSFGGSGSDFGKVLYCIYLLGFIKSNVAKISESSHYLTYNSNILTNTLREKFM